MKPTHTPIHECPTCGFRKWAEGETVCSHPALSRSITESLPAPVAFRVCEGRFWVEREDEE